MPIAPAFLSTKPNIEIRKMGLRNDIKAIQRHVGVKADGIFGPVSAAAVREYLKPTLGEMPAESSGDHEFDKRTEKNLRTLTPKAQAKFRPFIAQAQAVAASMGCDYRAISGHRSYAEQNALYAKGRTKPGKRVTNARGGYSNHNFGIALDFGVFSAGKYLDNADPKRAHRVHAAVGQIAAKHGIEWGGNWRSFKDTPHFEVKTGLSMAQKRARVRAGKEVL